MNSIYTKTVHKEYSTSHELHPITSARGVEAALKASQQGLGLRSGSFSFNSIFIDKKAHLQALLNY